MSVPLTSFKSAIQRYDLSADEVDAWLSLVDEQWKNRNSYVVLDNIFYGQLTLTKSYRNMPDAVIYAMELEEAAICCLIYWGDDSNGLWYAWEEGAVPALGVFLLNRKGKI